MTWRLYGSLPKHVLVPQTAVTAGRTFLEFDHLLDRAVSGPMWLKDPEIADIMVDALRYGENELRLYRLDAFVVMADHVHVLMKPNVELSNVTRAIKGYSARKANSALGRTGQPFWQDESFDRWVRDQAELNRIIRYIEKNPVSAGLVSKIEEYPWSSGFQAA